MLPAFINQNVHFALNIFAAMVFSWVFWLFLDAWMARKTLKELLKLTGFLFLTCYFVIHSFSIETSLIDPFVGKKLSHVIFLVSGFSGYILVLFGQLVDPVLPHPKLNNFKKGMAVGAYSLLTFSGTGLPIDIVIRLLFPIVAALVGLTFLYKATIGLEFHLRKVAYSFFGLSFYELLALRDLFTGSSKISIFNASSSFGSWWWLEHAVLLLSVLLLGSWVFTYLLKRLQTQLYIFFSITVILIFVISVVSFTGFLISNIKSEALSELKTNVKVLNFALNLKRDSLMSDAQVFAENSELVESITKDRKDRLAVLASDFLIQKNLSFLIVLDKDGQVIGRGEEPERIGESMSSNEMVKRALDQRSGSSVSVRDGVLGPEVLISASYPTVSGENIVGAVYLGQLVDNAFLDGLKKDTGFESSVYGGPKVSATTFVAEDNITRRVGIIEGNTEIINTVLGSGNEFIGETKFVNTPYISAYFPLKDVDSVPVGMLYVGRSASGVLATAGRSMQGSYVMAGLLWFFAVFPSYMLAGYISKQLR